MSADDITFKVLLELVDEKVLRSFDVNVAVKFAAQRRDALVGDAARHDLLKPGQMGRNNWTVRLTATSYV